MKKTLFSISLAILFAQSLSAQIVNIPDAAFKNYLIANKAINTNGDTEIQESEAKAYKDDISVDGLNIKTLIGIEAFVNINTLSCTSNAIKTLDVSKNVALVSLYCSTNQLITLDVSKNVALTSLFCGSN